MFAADTNIFLEHTKKKTLLSIANKDLSKFHQWFISNTISLDTGKTNFFLLH